jgi:competence protein ComEC
MRKKITILILALTLSVLLLNSLAHSDLENVLEVSFIDVGQGDSIWLHASDDTDILIDGGRRSAGPTVVAHLQGEGIDDIDVMVLSHGDTDHVGGLIDVLRSAIPVESVIYNGQHNDTDTYATLQAEMGNRGLTPTPAQIGQTYTWGEVDASVLNPQETPVGDQNENSVVMMITYGETDFLFTGDIGESAEQTIVDSGTPVAAEVLKVAHHGSKYSSSADFLEAVGAEVAVISVGDNPYGHPTDETLDRLRAAGARIFRTDRRGTIVVTTDGETYEIESDFLVFLPLAARMAGSVPTETPPGTTGNVVITDLFYDGVKGRQEPDEYVEIRNDDDRAIQLSGWTLRDSQDHVFTFPDHVMEPDQVCRVYTNEVHPEWCGFSYGSGSAIWNNSGDCAELRDGYGDTVDSYCY